MQFEYLNTFLIKILFSALCNIYTDLEDELLDEIVGSDDSIFSNYYSNEFFPLYQYFSIKYLTSEEVNLLEHFDRDSILNIINNCKIHNVYLYFIENIFIFYDILFMKFIKIDNYSSIIIFYNIFRFILILFLILFIIYNKNNIKLNLFFNYTKINFNYYNFLNKIINNSTKFKSKYINKLFKFN